MLNVFGEQLDDFIFGIKLFPKNLQYGVKRNSDYHSDDAKKVAYNQYYQKDFQRMRAYTFWKNDRRGDVVVYQLYNPKANHYINGQRQYLGLKVTAQIA